MYSSYLTLSTSISHILSTTPSPRTNINQNTTKMQFNLYALLFAGLAATGLAAPQGEIGNSGCYIREASTGACSSDFPKQCASSSGVGVYNFCCKTSVTWC